MTDDLDQHIDRAISDMLLELVRAKAKIDSPLNIRRARMRCVIRCVDTFIRMGVVSYDPKAGGRGLVL